MEKPEQIENSQIDKPFEILAYAAWIIALTATVGSLFFSEVMQLCRRAFCAGISGLRCIRWF
jgi:hypothetical protein